MNSAFLKYRRFTHKIHTTLYCMKNSLLFLCFFTVSSLAFSLKGQTADQIKQIRSQYDLGVLLQLENEFLQKTSSQRERVKELAEKLNIPLVIEENGTYRELRSEERRVGKERIT